MSKTIFSTKIDCHLATDRDVGLVVTRGQDQFCDGIASSGNNALADIECWYDDLELCAINGIPGDGLGDACGSATNCNGIGFGETYRNAYRLLGADDCNRVFRE
jgi:hypothetical protein